MAREYIVIGPDGHDIGRDPNKNDCVRMADYLGKGARVEELDDSLCKTGKVVHTAE